MLRCQRTDGVIGTEGAREKVASSLVQPHRMVDNSVFSPTGLTIPLDAVYPSFSSSMLPCSSNEDPDAPPSVVTPARFFPPAPALYSWLAPSWSYPVESSCEDAHYAPPSPEASHSRRLPRLSSRLHSLVSDSAGACGCRVPGERSKADEGLPSA
jgi:hypothetical protein